MARDEIRFVRRPATSLGYHLLAHLDLGRDAANLFVAGQRLATLPWVAPLRQAYASAPGRLRLQAIPLSCDEGESLIAATERFWPRTSDPDDVELLDRWRSAVRAVEPGFEDAGPREPAFCVDELARLRAVLWERRGSSPPLEIVDCPALGRSGRGMSIGGMRRVGVDLGQEPDHVMCQIFHEEVHAISDALIVREHRQRDTRVDAPGHEHHLAIEKTAVEVGHAILEARAPSWLGAYERWRGGWGA